MEVIEHTMKIGHSLRARYRLATVNANAMAMPSIQLHCTQQILLLLPANANSRCWFILAPQSTMHQYRPSKVRPSRTSRCCSLKTRRMHRPITRKDIFYNHKNRSPIPEQYSLLTKTLPFWTPSHGPRLSVMKTDEETGWAVRRHNGP